MSRLCYKNMFMKDHSSFVSCILSFSLTTVSETSIRGFYYLSICVVMKLGFINRQAGYMSNLLSWFSSTSEVENKIWKRNIVFQRSLFNLHSWGRGYFSPCVFHSGNWEEGKECFQLFGDCFFVFCFFFHSLQLSGPVSYVRSL